MALGQSPQPDPVAPPRRGPRLPILLGVAMVGALAVHVLFLRASPLTFVSIAAILTAALRLAPNLVVLISGLALALFVVGQVLAPIPGAAWLNGFAGLLIQSVFAWLLARARATTARRAAELEVEMQERARSEAALRASESRYRSLVDQTSDAIVLLDADGRLAEVNPAACTLLGRPRETLLGQPLATFIDPADLAARPLRGAALQAGQMLITERRLRQPDGTVVTVEATSKRLEAGLTLVTARDVTDRRRLEAELRQAQKMEAIGRLAGGVAHDFNNLLGVIVGYTEQLRDRPASEVAAEERQALDEIAQAGERATSLTRQLLTFSRQQSSMRQPVDLRGVVENISRLLGRLIGEDITLKHVLSAEPAQIAADPGQMEQVLLNLAVNARDAMPLGGQLTIELQFVELDELYLRRHTPVPPGRYVRLTVTDTGHGMDEATQGRIFEPFFTTKAPGQGTGLGLSTVYGIVQQHGGTIDVYSEVGRGTSFKLYFPGVAESSRPTAAAAPTPLARGTETILLVEDEPQLRTLAQVTLERAGYRVLVAPDGGAALAVAAATAEPIALLVTDVVMPGMGGRQLAVALAAARPALRVLFISGYTEDTVVRRDVLVAGTAFLQKPFTPSALTRAVRAALDHTGDATGPDPA